MKQRSDHHLAGGQLKESSCSRRQGNNGAQREGMTNFIKLSQKVGIKRTRELTCTTLVGCDRFIVEELLLSSHWKVF